MKAFRPLSLAAKTGLVPIARPELKSLDELLKLAKSKPNTINFASAAVGHPTHLAMEMFADRAGVRLVHIPYKGTPAALQSVIAGETSVTITGFAEALPYIKAGKVVALATTGPLPAEGFRNLPEMKQIHPDLDLSVWFAYFAPAGTPDEVISVLNREVAKAVAASDVRRRLGDFGLVPTSSTPEELDSLIAHDRARFGPLVRSLGLKAN